MVLYPSGKTLGLWCVWVIGDSGKAGEALNQVRDLALSWMQENPLLVNNRFAACSTVSLLMSP